MKKIDDPFDSMSITRHIRKVLQSPYTARQISKHCGVSSILIRKLRHHMIKLGDLSLSQCCQLEHFYRRFYLYGMNKQNTDIYTWHQALSKHILHLLHKVCLCAWSMKSDRQIWHDFKKLAKSYGKYYNYGMSNHPQTATTGYVKHIMHIPYHYATKKPFHLIMTVPPTKNNPNGSKTKIKSWNIQDYSRFQPEITQLANNQFDIATPYQNGFGGHLHLELAWHNNNWILITDTYPGFSKSVKNELSKLTESRLQIVYNDAYRLCQNFQINHTANDRYFIEIEDYSLQSAYYRLIHFELIHLAMIRLMLRIQ